MAKFVSALLDDSVHPDSGLFGEGTGLEVAGRKGVKLNLSTHNREAFV